MEQATVSTNTWEPVHKFLPENETCLLQNKKLCVFIDMFASFESAIEYLDRESPLNAVWYHTFEAVISVFGIFSCYVNFHICLLFPKVFNSTDSRLENWNLLSLTVANLGMCLFTFPQIIVASHNLGWNIGIPACIVDATLGGIFASAQIYSLVAIAVDRYLNIVHAFEKPPVNKRGVLKRCLIVWGTAILPPILPFCGLGRNMPDGIFISCTFNYVERDWNNVIYVMLLILVDFLVPAGIITFCYTGIAHHTRKSGSQFKHQSSRTSQKQQINRRDAAVIKAVIKLVTCFLVTWTPYTIIAILSLCRVHVYGLLATFAVVVAKLSTVITAGLYTLIHPNYKKAIWKRQSNYLKCNDVARRE